MSGVDFSISFGPKFMDQTLKSFNYKSLKIDFLAFWCN
jgi:hypothetical protein